MIINSQAPPLFAAHPAPRRAEYADRGGHSRATGGSTATGVPWGGFLRRDATRAFPQTYDYI